MGVTALITRIFVGLAFLATMTHVVLDQKGEKEMASWMYILVIVMLLLALLFR